MMSVVLKYWPFAFLAIWFVAYFFKKTGIKLKLPEGKFPSLKKWLDEPGSFFEILGICAVFVALVYFLGWVFPVTAKIAHAAGNKTIAIFAIALIPISSLFLTYKWKKRLETQKLLWEWTVVVITTSFIFMSLNYKFKFKWVLPPTPQEAVSAEIYQTAMKQELATPTNELELIHRTIADPKNTMLPADLRNAMVKAADELSDECDNIRRRYGMAEKKAPEIKQKLFSRVLCEIKFTASKEREKRDSVVQAEIISLDKNSVSIRYARKNVFTGRDKYGVPRYENQNGVMLGRLVNGDGDSAIYAGEWQDKPWSDPPGNSGAWEGKFSFEKGELVAANGEFGGREESTIKHPFVLYPIGTKFSFL